MLTYRLSAEKVIDKRLRRPKPFQRLPLAAVRVTVIAENGRALSYTRHLDEPWKWCTDNIGGLWNGWGLQDCLFMFTDDANAFAFKMRFDGFPVEERRR